MTESGAIRFQEAFYMMVNSEIGKEACKTAISALKEVGEYREIDVQIKKIFDGQLGLVDIVKEYIEDIRRTHNGKMPRKVIALSEEDAKNWEDYKEIGTVEECREAVSKQIPKEVKNRKILKDFQDRPYCIRGDCPKCGCERIKSINTDYCYVCGQRLRWDENLEGMEDE